VPIVEINSPYGYNIKKLPIPQRRDFMIEQLIAEATECDFKVALETKKPKSWLKSVSAFSNGRKMVKTCWLWRFLLAAAPHTITRQTE